jgi:hypothetical protein
VGASFGNLGFEEYLRRVCAAMLDRRKTDWADNVKRLRVIIVTDAGDGQDDEQSLVRFLVCGKSSEHLKYKWKRKIILFTLRATKD